MSLRVLNRFVKHNTKFTGGILGGLIRKTIRSACRPLTNNIKGMVGEIKVDSKLNPIFFDDVEHKQINNLTIKDANGKTHQIDHVEIRANGIFCIETKNYSGWIFGSEDQDRWTQVLGREKYKIINPVKQNKSHIYHLKNVLNNKYKVNSIVVMVQNNANRIDVPYVVNLRDLRTYLNQYNDGTFLSSDEMECIYNTIVDANKQFVSPEEHMNNIRNTKEKIMCNICPRCNSVLVVRTSKYGAFYGCSNYPKCKFTKKSAIDKINVLPVMKFSYVPRKLWHLIRRRNEAWNFYRSALLQ